jgi:SAM-dependent methyltransferase
VVGEGAAIPLRDACLDLICFGQSWHWVGQSDGALEVARVLREGGWWVAWWNHPWADSEEWFERYWSLLEARCAGVSRDQRNVDWCSEAIGSVGRFLAPVRNTIEWERRVSVENWLIDLSSHAYVIDISEGERTRLLRDVRSVLHHAFANGPMVLPYQTRIWMARLAN